MPKSRTCSKKMFFFVFKNLDFFSNFSRPSRFPHNWTYFPTLNFQFNRINLKKLFSSDSDGQSSRHQRDHAELQRSADDSPRCGHLSRKPRLRKIHSTSRGNQRQQADGQNCIEKSSFHVSSSKCRMKKR